MKAITVLQPWAWLLATGKKRCETRSWKTNYRGEILLHAGKGDPLGMTKGDRGIYANIIGEPYLLNAVNVLRYRENKVPFGAIIGKANLVNCMQIDELTAALIKEQHPDEYEFGDFTPGRYAWMMENAVLFDKPIPASGKQGLWNWEGEL